MSTVEDEVRAFNDAYERALADQDAEAVIALYRDDARIMMPGQPAIEGREAIGEVFRGWLKDRPAVVRFESEAVVAGGDLVVDIGQIVQAGGPSKYVVVHRRERDGSLRILIDAPSGNG